jgi:hypothetical protein
MGSLRRALRRADRGLTLGRVLINSDCFGNHWLPLDEVAGELTVYSFYCGELQAVLLAFIAKFSSVAGTLPIARQGATGRVLRLALASTG